MKTITRWFMVIIVILLGILKSNAHANNKASHKIILSSKIINMINQQFNGRIISVNMRAPENDKECKRENNQIFCLDKSGLYKEDHSYLLGVLANEAKVIIVTVDVLSNDILKIKQ